MTLIDDLKANSKSVLEVLGPWRILSDCDTSPHQSVARLWRAIAYLTVAEKTKIVRHVLAVSMTERTIAGKREQPTWQALASDAIEQAEKASAAAEKYNTVASSIIESAREIAGISHAQAKNMEGYEYFEIRSVDEGGMHPQSVYAICMCNLKANDVWQRAMQLPDKELLIENQPSSEDVAVAQKKEESCLLATACYDYTYTPELIALRRFRDCCLLSSWFGRLLVGTYYVLSPPLANLIRKSEFLRTLVRNGLVTPIYRCIQKK